MEGENQFRADGFWGQSPRHAGYSDNINESHLQSTISLEQVFWPQLKGYSLESLSPGSVISKLGGIVLSVTEPDPIANSTTYLQSPTLLDVTSEIITSF